MFSRLNDWIFSAIALGLALSGCTKMRSDLGRLDTIAEILQIGPALTQGRRAWRCGLRGGMLRRKCGEHSMKVFRLAAVIVLLTAPGLRADVDAQHQSDAGAAIQDAGGEGSRGGERQGLQGIAAEDPGRQGSSDPWGSVRGAETPKASAPASRGPKPAVTAN
jgi:hypothetical protein